MSFPPFPSGFQGLTYCEYRGYVLRRYGGVANYTWRAFTESDPGTHWFEAASAPELEAVIDKALAEVPEPVY